jgi:hypothetical protein
MYNISRLVIPEQGDNILWEIATAPNMRVAMGGNPHGL